MSCTPWIAMLFMVFRNDGKARQRMLESHPLYGAMK